MTLQELAQLKQRILAERCMETERTQPRITVGMGTCGIKAGAGKVLQQLQEELGDPLGMVITYVGCNGLCSYEPVVEVAMPGRLPVTYYQMTPEKASRVAREHVIGGRPVQDWVLPVNREIL